MFFSPSRGKFCGKLCGNKVEEKEGMFWLHRCQLCKGKIHNRGTDLLLGEIYPKYCALKLNQ
jgi:hypothetical protein